MSCPIVNLGCVDEQSTATFSIIFRDSAGVLHTPSEVKWEITDENGASLGSGTLTPAGSTVAIEVSGSVLALAIASMPTRYLSIYATVSSKPWRQEFTFTIRNAQRIVT